MFSSKAMLMKSALEGLTGISNNTVNNTSVTTDESINPAIGVLIGIIILFSLCLVCNFFCSSSENENEAKKLKTDCDKKGKKFLWMLMFSNYR